MTRLHALLLVAAALSALLAGDALKLEEKPDPGAALTFLQWLIHDGCTVFVWRGSDDQLWVEPTFCVPEPRRWLGDQDDAADCPSFDPVENYTYVTVPVMLTNLTMLEGVSQRLAHLKPNSVRYLSIGDLLVRQNTSGRQWELRFGHRDFAWSQSDDTGMLRLSCRGVSCSVLIRMIRDSRTELLDPLLALASLQIPHRELPTVSVSRAIAFQGAAYQPLWNFKPPTAAAAAAAAGKACADVVADSVLNVSVGNGSCQLRLHHLGARLFAEPLLCYTGGVQIVHDFNGDLRSLQLTVLLRSEAAVRGARAHGRNVTFMRLLEPGLAAAVGVGNLELLLATDGNSVLMQWPCSDSECREMRSAIESDPLVLFSRIKWNPVSWIESAPDSSGCRFEMTGQRLSVPLRPPKSCAAAAGGVQPGSRLSCGAVRCRFVRLTDGRNFLVIQQRRSTSARFDRKWTEYEAGFGDEHNFWIGLRRIAALTDSDRSLLRIEAKLWNGTELHAEYSGLRLLGSHYNLTYGKYLRDRSTTGDADPLANSRGFMFASMDKPVRPINEHEFRQQLYAYPSRYHMYNQYAWNMTYLGNAGWWWSNKALFELDFNPNGIFHHGEVTPAPGLQLTAFIGMNVTACGPEGCCNGGRGGTEWRALQEIRMMLEV